MRVDSKDICKCLKKADELLFRFPLSILRFVFSLRTELHHSEFMNTVE